MVVKSSKKKEEKKSETGISLEPKSMGKFAKKTDGCSCKAIFTGESIYSNKKEAFTLLSQSRFGEQKEGKVVYSLAEALYLVEKVKLQVL